MTTPNEDETIGFQYVEQRSTKKLRKRRNNPRLKWRLDQLYRNPPDFKKYLDVKRTEMNKNQWLNSSSSWLSQCLKNSNFSVPPRRIICLALGSFSPVDKLQTSPSLGETSSFTGIHGLKQSQYQLVFLLDVIIPVLSAYRSSKEPETLDSDESQRQQPEKEEEVEELPITVSFYDPAFNESDKENLKKLNYNVLDEEPSLFCEEPTFFYMPHAPKTLYERLLSDNSPPKSIQNSLHQVILLGNDLRNYQKILVQEDKNPIPFLMQIDPESIHAHYPPDLSDLNQGSGVYFFNETCLQWFNKS